MAPGPAVSVVAAGLLDELRAKNRLRPLAPAEGAGGFAGGAEEGAGEVGRVGIAELIGDLLDRQEAEDEVAAGFRYQAVGEEFVQALAGARAGDSVEAPSSAA